MNEWVEYEKFSKEGKEEKKITLNFKKIKKKHTKNDRFIYCAAFEYTRAANLLFFQTVFALFLWGGP